MDTMSRAVAGGVKNWPSVLRRVGSSVALRVCLASSAIARGSDTRAFSVKRMSGAATLFVSSVRAVIDDLCEYSGSTEIVAYLKRYLAFNTAL
jgi:hypothetical protein